MEPELLPQRPRPAGLQLQLFGMLKQSRRAEGPPDGARGSILSPSSVRKESRCEGHWAED